MTTRAQALIPVTIAAVIIGVIGMLTLPSDSKLESVEFPRGTILVDDVAVEVQIADTEPRRVRGLMFQEQLPLDQGMIFVFQEPGLYSLWMLNMQFSLDMMWFDRDGNVVHIEENVPPCKTVVEITGCQSVVPENEALYVLEVTSGFIKQNNITKNSKLTIISI
ncbi:MAG: DUF192 domain-containing protein [Nitrosopumilus sp.]|nr:DUF192 domain-containing protein [Nitrosopumilus sp.]NNL37311.1 DUF192 domain-containing protein [Nitrosopumilus sp.]NNM35752.1 DUF192 domain-containing protein [Nitrosopumilus sp.]